VVAPVHVVAAAYATGPGSARSVISVVISAVGQCTRGGSGLPHSTQWWRSMQEGGDATTWRGMCIVLIFFMLFFFVAGAIKKKTQIQ
jgi:hypothetical protein